MFQSLLVGDQWQQMFYGLDGVGVGTFPRRDTQPFDHFHLHDHT
jgi:hypothetical protein